MELSRPPRAPFPCVTWVRRRADRYGKVKAGRVPPLYPPTRPRPGASFRGLGAYTVAIYDAGGVLVAEHLGDRSAPPPQTPH